MLSEADIQDAGDVLRGGGVVAFPTETVYGLGANALDAEAVAKVFAAKARPSFDPLIVHVPDPDAAFALWREVPALARTLAEAFWPGPLTMVLPKADAIPGIVTSGLGTVGVRVPRHEVAQRLLRAAGVPVAAPSANAFGGISPTRAEHVAVPCDRVLDGGPCSTGVESTVVGFADPSDPDAPPVTVLRLGGTAVEALESVVGQPIPIAKPGAKLASPGMLERHYAPRTPLHLVDRLEAVDPARLGNRRVALLSLQGETGRGMGFTHIRALSPTGDLTVAAAHLFEVMHELDRCGVDLILAERVPDHGLGRAINDRLRRAATS